METFPIAGMGPFIQNLSHIILSCFFLFAFHKSFKSSPQVRMRTSDLCSQTAMKGKC